MTANPLVAARIEEPGSVWAGVWIAEDLELIAQSVESGSWIDGSLGVVGAGLDGLALVSDPVGALLQYGIAWLIEHVRPLSEALDWLAGDPAQIAAHALTWRNVASSLRAEADSLAGAMRSDIGEWHGAASDAYRGWSSRRDQSLRALARASDTMALITEGAGLLIGTVRMMVRDAVATVVSRLIVYAGELIATAGLATPLVAEQVITLVASWAAKIAHWLRDLIASLRSLASRAGRVGELIEALIDRLMGRRSGDVDGAGAASGGKGGQAEPPNVPHEPVPPTFDDPTINPAKISRYAMNPDHPVGRHKYQVIHSATGLDTGDAALIEEQIREGVRTGTPVFGAADQHGQRWAVDVPLTGPSGTMIVRTAWIIDAGQPPPRLVTISFPK